jgi:hypothetical protein
MPWHNNCPSYFQGFDIFFLHFLMLLYMP